MANTNHNFPVGVTTLQSVLQAPFVSGGYIRGKGSKGVVRPGSLLDGTGSSVVGQIRVAGTNWDVGDFELRETPYKEVPLLEKVGIQIHKPKKGLGSGKHNFHDLSFVGFQHAIRFGETASGHNCDQTLITNCKFYGSESAITLTNGQSMGHTIDHSLAYRCGNFVKVEAGGNIRVRGVLMIGGTLLAFKDITPKYLGPNNANYVFDHVKFDAQSRDGMKLVEMERPIFSATMKFNDVHFAATKQPGEVTHLQLVGGAVVTIRDGKNFRSRSIVCESNGKGHIPRILIEDTSIMGGVGADVVREGSCYLIQRNCFDGYGKPLPPFEGRVDK